MSIWRFLLLKRLSLLIPLHWKICIPFWLVDWVTRVVNETAVIKVATKICEMLHKKYPQFIAPLDYYLSAKNLSKYTPVEVESFSRQFKLRFYLKLGIFQCPQHSHRLLSPSDKLLHQSRRFQCPRHLPELRQVACLLRQISRIRQEYRVQEGHASILSAYQVVHDGQTKRTKELFTELGWERGLEPLLN